MQQLTGCQEHIIMDTDGTRNYQTQTKTREDVRIICLKDMYVL